MTGADSRLVQLSESIFKKTTHVHGLTKTVKPLLHVAASLYENGYGGNGGGEGKQDAASLLETDRLEELPPDLPSWQRAVVTDVLQIEASRHEKTGETLRSDDSSHAEIAKRLAAVIALASELAKRSPDEADLVAAKENGQGLCLWVRGLNQESGEDEIGSGTDLWNKVMPCAAVLKPVPPNAEFSDAMLRPDYTLEEALHLIVRKQLRQFLSRLYGLSCNEDPEYVHEMRVATRRMRAAMKLLKGAMSPPFFSLRTEAKTFASALGELRDLDVFLDFLVEYRDQQGEENLFVEGLSRELRTRRRQGIEDLHRLFSPEKMERFRERYSWSFGPPQPSKDEKAVLLGKAAPKLIKKRLKKTLGYGPSLKKNTPEENHSLRIRCKGCRYAAEFLSDLYPKGLQELIDPMTEMQDLLGNVHDADVYSERISAFSESCSAANRDPGGQEVLLAYVRDWRKKSLKQASATWKHFLKPGNVGTIKKQLKRPLTV